MTDRDTFAAAALTGLLAHHGLPGPERKNGVTSNSAARWAYVYADKMLRYRERVAEPMPEEKRAEVSATLTAEEREAIDWFSRLSYGNGGTLSNYCATLRALLECLP